MELCECRCRTVRARSFRWRVDGIRVEAKAHQDGFNSQHCSKVEMIGILPPLRTGTGRLPYTSTYAFSAAGRPEHQWGNRKPVRRAGKSLQLLPILARCFRMLFEQLFNFVMILVGTKRHEIFAKALDGSTF